MVPTVGFGWPRSGHIKIMYRSMPVDAEAGPAGLRDVEGAFWTALRFLQALGALDSSCTVWGDLPRASGVRRSTLVVYRWLTDMFDENQLAEVLASGPPV